MVGAGASMATHNNCIYVFGGMDEERAEHMYLFRWDLSSDIGFEPITYRSAMYICHCCFSMLHTLFSPQNFCMSYCFCCMVPCTSSGFVRYATFAIYRGPVPPKLTAGHYAAVFGDELWVFPGPRNHNMMRVYCCDLTRYRWTEREVRGEPPVLSESRRNLDCFLDGKRLIVFGMHLASL